jgi:hemerythrin
MSDILPWSDLYATGYHAVDADHKGLFALINDLHEKVQEGFDPDSIGVTIGALEYYVQNHFAREEELMKGQRYAGLDDHVLKHRKLESQVAYYRRAFDEDPAHFDMTDFMAFLSLWLSDHILTEDMDYVSALQDHTEH